LTILCSGVNIEYGKTASSELVVRAISGTYGKISGYLLGFMMAVFAISSVIGWGFYGNVCCDFLFGKKGVAVFKILYPITCIFGAISSSAFAWETASLFNGIMLIINLPVIMLLWSGEEVKK
jgi:AGCS family alanine or glycine:cation symporter